MIPVTTFPGMERCLSEAKAERLLNVTSRKWRAIGRRRSRLHKIGFRRKPYPSRIPKSQVRNPFFPTFPTAPRFSTPPTPESFSPHYPYMAQMRKKKKMIPVTTFPGMERWPRSGRIGCSIVQVENGEPSAVGEADYIRLVSAGNHILPEFRNSKSEVPFFPPS
jgi:hypothetical protein